MQIAFRYNKEGERNKTKLPIPLKKSLTKRTRSNKNNNDCGKKHRTRAKNLKMQKKQRRCTYVKTETYRNQSEQKEHIKYDTQHLDVA